VKDGDVYPYSKMLINESDKTKTFNLDVRYTWMDKDKNLIENKVDLEPRDAMVLFYK
jgi:hypothetical protein